MRPFVYINMASTVDGKITSAAREYPRFTSRFDRDHMDRLRASADALLVAAGTLRADNPRLDVRSDAMREERVASGRPPGLHRVVVSGSGRIEGASRFFEDDHGARRILAVGAEADEDALLRAADRCEIWRDPGPRIDLARLLRRLREEGVERLLCEGGGELNASLFELGLVDELNLTLAPAVLGGREAPTIAGGEGLAMADRRRLELVDCRREGDELYLRYRVPSNGSEP